MKQIKIFSLALFLSWSGVHGQTVTVQPYLQNPAPDGVTVMWRTAEPCYSRVEYGTDTINLKIARDVQHGIVVANNTANKIRITGLKPGQKYYYRICSEKIDSFGGYKKIFGSTYRSPFHSFTTFESKRENFIAVIFNDIHSKLPVFEKLTGLLQKIDYDFAVFNGDCFQDPSSETNELNVLSCFVDKMNGAEKPLYFLRGNHETRGAFALGWPSLFDWEGNKPYFAFSFGDTRFVLLDNGEDKVDSSPEYSGLIDFADFRNEETVWLTKETESEAFKQAKRRILIHHTPIYGWENKYSPGFIACKDLWEPIFRTTPFDVAITGHLHRYTYYPKNAVGNPFPLVIGGGNTEKAATAILLEKRGNKLTIKILWINGKEEIRLLDV
ncbi:MAG: metallophosphoesterase [Prevotellaceae bacterium]|jgi:predicted phosphodiesterase|nr:metallophosphoesterase [Prevotellaceae bacterium]